MVWDCVTAGGMENLIFIDGISDEVKYLKIFERKFEGKAG